MKNRVLSRILSIEVISTSVIALTLYILFSEGGVLNYYYAFDISFVALPSLVALGILTAAVLFKKLFEGRLVEPLYNVFTILSLILFVFLIIKGVSYRVWMGTLANILLLVFPASAGYILISALFRTRKILSASLRSSLLILLGIYLRGSFFDVIPEQVNILGGSAGIVLGNGTIYGLIFNAFAVILSTLEVSDYPGYSKIRSWLKPSFNKVVIFVLGFSIGLYVSIFRSLFLSWLGGRYFVIEWLGLILFGLIGFLFVSNIAEKESKSVQSQEWGKHRQVEEKLRDVEREELKELIDDFVEDGSKKGLIVYLVSKAVRQGKSWKRALDDLKDLLNYQEKDLPLLKSFIGHEKIRSRIKRRRRKVLEKTIENLERGA